MKIPDCVMPIYIKTINGDDDKEIVAQGCMSVAEIIKDFGYDSIKSRINSVILFFTSFIY